MVGVGAVIDRGGLCVDRGCWIAARERYSQGGSAQVTRLYCLLAAATSPLRLNTTTTTGPATQMSKHFSSSSLMIAQQFGHVPMEVY